MCCIYPFYFIYQRMCHHTTSIEDSTCTAPRLINSSYNISPLCRVPPKESNLVLDRKLKKVKATIPSSEHKENGAQFIYHDNRTLILTHCINKTTLFCLTMWAQLVGALCEYHLFEVKKILSKGRSNYLLQQKVSIK